MEVNAGKNSNRMNSSNRSSTRESITNITIFKSSKDHLQAELTCLELLLQAQLLHKQQFMHDTSEWSRFFITEEEVIRCLNGSAVKGDDKQSSDETLLALNKLKQQHQLARNLIVERVQKSIDAGVFLRLVWLAQVCSLSMLDVDILLLTLAPSIESRYQRVYAYLQDDLQKKYLTVDLALQLIIGGLSDDWSARQAARARFAENMPLIQHRLLRLLYEPDSPLLARQIQVDARIVEYLLDSDELDSRLLAFTRKIVDRTSTFTSCLSVSDKQSLLVLIKQTLIEQQKNTILYLQGSSGMGRQSLVAELCQTLGITLLVVNIAELLAIHDLSGFKQSIDLLLRELLLQRAAIYWQAFDLLLGTDKRLYLEYYLANVEQHVSLHFLGGNRVWEPAAALTSSYFLRVPISALTAEQRQGLWQQLQQQTNIRFADNIDLAVIADRYRLTLEQIQAAWQTAVQLSIKHNPQQPVLKQHDLQQACQLHSSPNLQNLAVKITPRYRWQDIVLPEHHLILLEQMRDHLKHQRLVYEQWGFADKLALTKGIYALFSGPPGTGKTMAAEILANELGLLLYKIDLSSIVNKYIGETEKNLERVFTEAENSNILLFFDEADALFGKRSEVQDAHDRYANIEISYLLQRLETYSGVVILASNFRRNIDEAFVRRLHFCIDFPLPDVAERKKIWQAVWPHTVSQDTLDMDLLAKRFDITGANIRNIALNAAFFATAKSKKQPKIAMQHVLKAVQLEYQKMGRLIMPEEFALSPNEE